MRIIIHFNDLTGKIKGSDRSRLELAKRLSRNHEVIALANQVGNEKFPFEVVQMPKPKALAFYHYYLAEITLNPDVVITKTFFCDAPSLAIAHTGNVLKMFQEDSKWKKPVDWQVSKKVIELTMAKAGAVVARSAETAQELRELYGLDCLVIPNGVDTGYFKPLKLLRYTNRAMMAGTLSHRKGAEALIEIIRQTPGINWRICGDGPFRAELAKLPNAQVLGWVKSEQLVKEYNEAGLFVLPARYDPFPLVVLEALACNTPVVISQEVAVGGLVDEKVGYRVPVDDIEAYVGAVTEGINKDWGDEPRKNALAYDWDIITKSYEKVLLQLVRNKGGN